MTERVDQRICIKFCCKLEHSSAETVRMIKKAFQDESMSEAQIKMWYKRFKEGRESVESDIRSGRPLTSRTPENVERVKTAINENRRLTIRELENDLGIPRTSVSEILKEDLGMTRVAGELVPRLLTCEQKELGAETSQDLPQAATNDPNFLDKAWVSRAGADAGSSSVTDPVWRGHENALGSSEEIIEKKHSRSKEIKTEQSSSDEYLDGNESKMCIDVSEHSGDSRKRKHSMGDWEEPSSVSDGRKYIKSEDDIDEKIDVSKDCMCVEPYEEQEPLRDRSQVTDASLTNIKQEPDSDNIVWIRDMT